MTFNNKCNGKNDNNENVIYQIIPPDGGWGWIIVFTSFLSQFIADGCLYTVIVFYNDFSEEFDKSIGKISMISSVSTAFYFFSGPIASSLINKFGYRVVGFMSGIITAISYLYSSLACTSFSELIIINGVCTGFGLGMTYLVSNVVIGLYFEKWRALATGLSSCGSGLGTLLIPPFMDYLRITYGWRKSYYVLTVLMIAIAILSLLYLPLQPVNVNSTPSTSKNVPKSKPKKGFCLCCPFNFKNPSQINELNTIKEKENENSYTSIQQITCAKCCKEQINDKSKYSISLKSIFKAIINIRLLKSVCFHIFLWCGFFLIGGYMIPMFYITDRAKSIGMDEQLSVWLLSLIGLTITVGRVIGGLLQTLPKLDVIVYSYVLFIVAGIATILSSLNIFLNVTAQIIYAIIFGASCSSFFLRPVIAIELFGIENLSTAFGLQMFFMGFGTSSILYCSGLLLDKTGSHQYVFILGGAFIIIAGILMMMLRISKDWEIKKGILKS